MWSTKSVILKRFLVLTPGAAFLVWLTLLLSHEQTTPAFSRSQGIGAEVERMPGSIVNSETYTYFMPVVHKAPLEPPYDMALFMIGDGRLYEVWHSNDSQARHQTQVEGTRFYHTKGDEVSAEWEELWTTEQFIVRGVDTSPGNNQYYVAYDTPGVVGGVWSPRFWDVGDLFERNTFITFHNKEDCSLVASGFQQSWLQFLGFYQSYTFGSGITLYNVIELAWLLSPTAAPTETYFYAVGYGLVGWTSVDRGFSYISEIHDPGQRPDNTREAIGCLGQSLLNLPLDPDTPIGPLPWPYRAK